MFKRSRKIKVNDKNSRSSFLFQNLVFLQICKKEIIHDLIDNVNILTVQVILHVKTFHYFEAKYF